MTQPPKIIFDLVGQFTKDAPVAFSKLSGGRTNSVWLAQTETQKFVCKLFASHDENPLFPNSPKDEIKALRHLIGSSVAPTYLAAHTDQTYAILYSFVEGEVWTTDSTAVGHLFRTLHDIIPPSGLRHIPSGSDAIRDQILSLMKELPSQVSEHLLQLMPNETVTPISDVVFLHGDGVPGNIVVSDQSATFIDWQCPAVGEAAEDLFIFMSPAMQMLYRGHVLTKAEQGQLLDSYKDENTRNRLEQMKPFFHLRMAAYCYWKYFKGNDDYKGAAHLEIDALKHL